MRKGYILSLSLYVFMTVSIITSIKLLHLKQLHEISIVSEKVYRRLSSEKEVFDEILFNLSLYEDDDFEHVTSDYTYDIRISKDDVIIYATGEEDYTISLKYNDECICFVEILYD